MSIVIVDLKKKNGLILPERHFTNRDEENVEAFNFFLIFYFSF